MYITLDEKLMAEIIKHMYANRHLSNLGYDSMTVQMQNLFNNLVCKPIGDRNV